MATYTLTAYAPASVNMSNYPFFNFGDTMWIDSNWDVNTDALTITVTDDDSAFQGDVFADDVGDDTSQTAVVTDASGATLASGRVYLDDHLILSDGQGNTFHLYSVEIGGTIVGAVVTPEWVPGVQYEIVGYANVEPGNTPDYADLATLIYDPDTGQTYQGGAFNDTIYSGLGDDTIYGGDGDDTIYYGSGGNTVGDIVYGGAGNDYIDDTSGIQTSGVDQIYGEDGNDTIYSGDGGDYVSGGAGADIIHAEGGDDTIDGGSGNDLIFAGDGDDVVDPGSGNDVVQLGSGYDTLILQDGSGADTVFDWDFGDDDSDGFTNDQLDVSGLTNALGDPVRIWDVTVVDDGSGNAQLSFPNGESLTLTGVAPASVDSGPVLYSMGIPCYVAGTHILTPDGPRPIEDLKPDDLVVTREAGVLPILWAGRRRLGHRALARNPALRPIVVRAGTFGASSDLWISPQHGVALTGAATEPLLVRGHQLLKSGDGRVRRADGKRAVTYHHLLLPQHALIQANGLWSESLYPGAFALAGFNRATMREVFSLFPALAPILSHPNPAVGRRLLDQLYGPSTLPYLRGSLIRNTGQHAARVLDRFTPLPTPAF